ncbi:MAG TPA: hypothetical protein PKY59_18505, partial [Pyrinomonadaceae bacterium]|nr:hypothetical protein [Pyrinomonadaceae bacterium]
FHYVVGAIIALFSCLPFIHLAIGIMFLTGNMPEPKNPADAPPFPKEIFGLMFTVIPAIIILCGWTLAICTIIAGRKLSKQTSYMFCIVVAAILCIFTPFGTVLGVFTIIVLMRDSVKALFNKPTFQEYGGTSPDWK